MLLKFNKRFDYLDLEKFDMQELCYQNYDLFVLKFKQRDDTWALSFHKV